MAVMASVRRTQEYASGNSGPGMNVVAVAILLGAVAAGGLASYVMRNPIPVILTTLIGLLLAPSPKIAQQWERAIVLRLGRYVGLRGPGLFWIVPVRRPRVVDGSISGPSPPASPPSRR